MARMLRILSLLIALILFFVLTGQSQTSNTLEQIRKRGDAEDGPAPADEAKGSV